MSKLNIWLKRIFETIFIEKKKLNIFLARLKLTFFFRNTTKNIWFLVIYIQVLGWSSQTKIGLKKKINKRKPNKKKTTNFKKKNNLATTTKNVSVLALVVNYFILIQDQS